MRQLEDVRSNDRSRLKIARKLLLRVTLFVKLRPLAQHLSTMDQTLSLSRIAIKNSKLKSEDTKWRYDKEKRKKKKKKRRRKNVYLDRRGRVEILNARPHERKSNSRTRESSIVLLIAILSGFTITRRVEDVRQWRPYKLRKRDVSSFPLSSFISVAR